MKKVAFRIALSSIMLKCSEVGILLKFAQKVAFASD